MPRRIGGHDVLGVMMSVIFGVMIMVSIGFDYDEDDDAIIGTKGKSAFLDLVVLV